jgi:hypothetical protein
MSNETIAWILFLLSVVLVVVGLVFIALSYLVFKVPDGYALVDRKADGGRHLPGKWMLYLHTPGDMVPLKKETRELPKNGNFIQLQTPDDGLIGLKVSLTYSPDRSSGEALQKYNAAILEVDKVLEARINSALSSWVKGKPLPGTAKRALTMKDEAENFVRAKITSMPATEAMVVHGDPSVYYDSGYAVFDLGVRIHEIHITEMQELKRGTGKADWGDGDETAFNAEKVFNQFKGQAGNLSNLRKLKDALIDRYREEAEDIEDIYDQVRLSMKEGE